MTQRDVMEKFRALPPEAQQQVLDFMTFLARRYRPVKRSQPKRKLSEEKFVGIWRGRVDLENSIGWVRDVRRTEWGNVG
jgi:mRNA-degrading endonuclease RelE of RelBE toxin-antitoxin system